MAPTLVLSPFGPLSLSERRLACGLALSLLAHLMLIVVVRPLTAEYAPRTPLQVEIQQLAPEPDAPLSIPAPPDAAADSGPATPAVASARPEPVRPVPGAVPDLQPDPRLPVDRYYASFDVDVRAEPLNDPPLVYPVRAYQLRARGKVTLRILINERGGVDDVTVMEAEPRGFQFEEAALAAARALQFSPAMRFGQRVKSRKELEVVFNPYESINVP
jgi:TonB family protein